LRPLGLLLAAWVALAAAVAACGRDVDPPAPSGETITPRAFAAVVTELAIARAQLLPDTAAYRARMAQILAMHRVTADEVRAFAQGYAGNEDVLQPVYEFEGAAIDSLFPAFAPGGPPEGAIPPGTVPAAPGDTVAGG
jgi:hypothetical protein